MARLAAQGLTNRQIAQALFVSTKTVGTHLGHIYDKLAVNRLAITADLLERRIDALDSRADEVYRKWRNEYQELRYRAPSATRLFQVAFRIAPMNQKA